MTNIRTMDLDLDDSLDPTMGEDGSVRCVFSTMEMMKVGTGTTTRKHASKLYWFVEEEENEMFSVRQINTHHIPAGDRKTIPLQELMNRYIPEIEFYEEKTIPAMEVLEDHLDDGDQYFSDGKLYSAEGSYNKALKLDEQNVRALFNLGLIYLELKDMDKAKDMMGDLLGVKSAFDGKNQHLFNEFGISLRKSGMFDEAVEYYTHALKYVKKDENLYYNIARANYERSNWEECVKALEKIFEINPRLEVAHELISIILTLANHPKLCEKNNKQSVPQTIVRSINSLFGKRPEFDPGKTKVPSDLLRFSAGATKPASGRARSGAGSSKPNSGGGLRFDMD